MRSCGTESLDSACVNGLDVVIRSSSARAGVNWPRCACSTAQPSLYCPDHPAKVVVPGAAHGVSYAGKSGLFESREPALARHEPTYIPPSPEKSEKEIKGPGRAAPLVGTG